MSSEIYILIKGLILNFSIIILSICLYQILFIERAKKLPDKVNKLLVSIFALITVFLCMTYSIPSYADGFYFDFRSVPFYIAGIYGGPIPAFIIFIEIIVYRFYLGGAGAYISLVVSSFTLILIITFYKKFKKATTAWRLKFSLLFMLVTSSFLMILLYFNVYASEGFVIQNFLFFAFIYTFIQLLFTFIAISLIESIIEKVEMKRNLIRINRLHAASELAGAIAHEIRSPLTVAKGFLQLMLGNTKLNPIEKQYLTLSVTEMERAERVIQDYIAISNPIIEEKDNIQLQSFFHDLLNEHSYLMNCSNIPFQIKISPNMEIRTDKQKLKIAISNIIVNGLEAMPHGGKLVIKASLTKKHLLITIIDNGIGMSEEELERIGTPFYSLKNKGTGIGLMVSYQIIKAMGGAIKIASEKNIGTRVSLLLPESIVRKGL